MHCVETRSGTEGRANARCHPHLPGDGPRQKGQARFLTHTPCACVQGAVRSKAQGQKRARVLTECGGGQTDGRLWLPPTDASGRHMGPQRHLEPPPPHSKSQ